MVFSKPIKKPQSNQLNLHNISNAKIEVVTMVYYLIICYASYKLTRILLAWFDDIRKKWRKSREIKAFPQALVSLFFSRIVPRLHPASRKQAGWQRLDAKSGAYHGTGIMPVIPCSCQVWHSGINPVRVTHFLTAPRPLYRAVSYTFNDTLLSNPKPHPWRHLKSAQLRYLTCRI